MAGKVIAVDLDEAAHALKLLAEYLPGGGGLMCTAEGVPGTDEGVARDFYWRLASLEYNVTDLATKISADLQKQHLAIVQTVQALVEADDSLAEGASELLAQLDSMAPPVVTPAVPVSSDQGVHSPTRSSGR